MKNAFEEKRGPESQTSNPVCPLECLKKIEFTPPLRCFDFEDEINGDESLGSLGYAYILTALSAMECAQDSRESSEATDDKFKEQPLAFLPGHSVVEIGGKLAIDIIKRHDKSTESRLISACLPLDGWTASYNADITEALTVDNVDRLFEVKNFEYAVSSSLFNSPQLNSVYESIKDQIPKYTTPEVEMIMMLAIEAKLLKPGGVIYNHALHLIASDVWLDRLGLKKVWRSDNREVLYKCREVSLPSSTAVLDLFISDLEGLSYERDSEYRFDSAINFWTGETLNELEYWTMAKKNGHAPMELWGKAQEFLLGERDKYFAFLKEYQDHKLSGVLTQIEIENSKELDDIASHQNDAKSLLQMDDVMKRVKEHLLGVGNS